MSLGLILSQIFAPVNRGGWPSNLKNILNMDFHYVTAEEFRQILREELDAHLRNERIKERKVFLNEAMKRLGVSDTTLWRWDKEGYLPKHKREGGGGRPWYWESEIRRLELGLDCENEGGPGDE